MGISLGVGVVVAVELINDSALASFAQSVDLLSGKATHSIVSGYGRIEDRLFAEVWKNRSIQSASPIIEAMAVTLETGDEPLQFIGIDPFLDAEFRKLTPRDWTTAQLTEFVAGEIPSAYLSQELMRKYHLGIGATLTVLTAGIEKKVKILGGIPPRTEKGIGENMAIMDISAAQEVFGRQGYLDRIDIISSANVHDLARSLPESLKLTDANSRKSALNAMLYSFQLNLAAMSLLVSLCGHFSHLQFFHVFSFITAGRHVSIVDSRLRPPRPGWCVPC